MTKTQIILLVSSVIYFTIQSAMDIKNKKVSVHLNNLALVVSFFFYFFDLVHTGNISILEIVQTFVVCFIIACLSKYAHWFGSGDAKAMIFAMLSLRYVSTAYPYVDILMLLITVFTANVLFLVFHKIIYKHEKGKHAFFPFLTIGYVLTFLLGIRTSQ